MIKTGRRYYPKVIIDGKELNNLTDVVVHYPLEGFISVTITVFPNDINDKEIILETVK